MKLKCDNWVEIKEIIYENMNLNAWSETEWQKTGCGVGTWI